MRHFTVSESISNIQGGLPGVGAELEGRSGGARGRKGQPETPPRGFRELEISERGSGLREGYC